MKLSARTYVVVPPEAALDSDDRWEVPVPLVFAGESVDGISLRDPAAEAVLSPIDSFAPSSPVGHDGDGGFVLVGYCTEGNDSAAAGCGTRLTAVARGVQPER